MCTHAVGTELELHVDVPIVLETMLKGDDVRVVHRLMDFDLSKELQA